MSSRLLTLSATVAALVLSSSTLRAESQAPMDHSAMAQSYETEAKEAQQKAASHEQEMKRYENLGVPKGSGVTMQGMVTHCQKLSNAYKSAATEATALAKGHRQMAQASK